MHIIFQFPVVDFRSLLEGESVRLSKPAWPNPDVNKKQFIRNFGKVKQRLNGGDDNWSAEEYFCDAHVAVKYKDLHLHKLALSPVLNVIALDCYRRFYSDGKFMNKFELGFIDDLEQRSSMLAKDTGVNLISVLKHYADLEVQVNEQPVKLFEAGNLLAKSLCSATTETKKMYSGLQEYVVDGQLCITIVLSPAAGIELPALAKKINVYETANGKIEHYGYNFTHCGCSIKVWILRTTVKLNRNISGSPMAMKLRRLRINLLRVHAEKETIRILLNAISSKQVSLDYESEKAAAVEDYLKELTETLFKKKRLETEQKDILDFALEGEQAIAPGNIFSLWRTVAQFNSTFARNNLKKVVGKMRSSNRKVILFLSSAPKGKIVLDFGAELAEIDRALEASADRDNYEIVIKLSVLHSELLGLLNKHQPDFIHIVLHNSKDNGLYFKDYAGNALAMSVDEFKDIVGFYSEKKKPEAVLLSACNSIAHALAITGHCGYAMGTNNVLPDRAGIAYARNFYEFLFNDNNTDIPYCHRAGLLGIKQVKPAIAPINGVLAETIPELIS